MGFTMGPASLERTAKRLGIDPPDHGATERDGGIIVADCSFPQSDNHRRLTLLAVPVGLLAAESVEFKPDSLF